MIPVARDPYTAWPAAAPIALMPGIASSCPDPVTVDPDIIWTGSYGGGINDIGGLGLYISIYCTAGEAQKAAGNGYCQ